MNIEVPSEHVTEPEPVVSFQIVWKSKLKDAAPTIWEHRSEHRAKEIASTQTAAGFDTKLYRVEKTEIDF